MVLVELLARIIADVESGNIKRQKRDASIGDVRAFSLDEIKRIFFFSINNHQTNNEEFSFNIILICIRTICKIKQC
jgi:hypothetical protein